MSQIKDIALTPSGEMKIDWVERNMPVLRGIGEDFKKTQPFAGLKIALSVHLEAKTAYLCRVLEMGGAEMYVTGSNPLSTQDDVAAALASGGMEVFASYGCTMEEYEDCLCRVLEVEETTTGIHRLRIMAKNHELRFPMVMVNEADCKHMFDNRYGTGQSVWDGINRTTNLIVAGKYVVVSGYGWCGKGVALRAKGLGAKVIVTEVDPIRALEAVMDGYEVMPMKDAARVGDMFVTVTGCSGIITTEHFETMKDGAILTNAGHFDVEVDMAGLEKLAVRKYDARHNIQGYVLPNGKTLFTIAEGRLVNLAAGDGHPAEIMDMSFAVQALSAEYLAQHRGELAPDVIAFPHELDLAVARRKLRAMGVETDSLSGEQAEYLGV